MSDSSSRASLTKDFERFKRELPRDFPAHVRDTYHIDLSAHYLGQPLPHPVGKGSGQLSLNTGQLEADAAAGLAFAVLKTVVAQDEAAGPADGRLGAAQNKKKKEQRRGGGEAATEGEGGGAAG